MITFLCAAPGAGKTIGRITGDRIARQPHGGPAR
jgi:hypothetical protein